MDIAHIINTIVNARRLRRIIADILQESELSYNELELLYTVEKNKKVRPTRLANITEQKISTLSRVVHKLEEKDLLSLEVSYIDRRNVIVNITPKGQELLGQCRNKVLDK